LPITGAANPPCWPAFYRNVLPPSTSFPQGQGCIKLQFEAFADRGRDSLSISINLIAHNNIGGSGKLHGPARSQNAQSSGYGPATAQPMTDGQRRNQCRLERVTSFQHQPPPAQRLASGIPRGKKSSPPATAAPRGARLKSCPASRRWPIGRHSWEGARLPGDFSDA